MIGVGTVYELTDIEGNRYGIFNSYAAAEAEMYALCARHKMRTSYFTIEELDVYGRNA